jgi:two-component system sensor kinase FixL
LSEAATSAGGPLASTADLQAQALLDAVVDAVIVIDASGRIEQVSRSATQMFGSTAEQLIGCNVSTLMPEPYRREHANYMSRYLSGGAPRIIGIGREVQAQRSDGTVFPCNLSVGEVPGAEPRRFLGIIHDLSARHEAEDRLRRSEAELQLAQQLANVGNYVNYVDGDQPDYYSAQMRRIMGLPEDWARVPLDRYVEEWVHPDDRTMVAERIQHLVEDDVPFDIEYRITVGDGTERYLHHIAQCQRNERGQITRFFGTIHDVTDRHRVEVEARQLQDRLTHFSRLSTMGEMAAGLAHEVNQPLTAIAAYAQACQRLLATARGLPEGVLHALAQIDAQALRAGEVIRRLRHLVRNREVKRETIQVERLLDDLRTLAEADARAHGIRLLVDCEPGLPTVEADPVQIQQVVLNLVRNAIDSIVATPTAPRELALGARIAEADAETLEFMVEDHGPGVPDSAVDQVFNQFYTTKPGGTGLGLAISRTIVRAHGGRLWYSPVEGGGARFHFTLPISPASSGETS